jgi:hypothetical protein
LRITVKKGILKIVLNRQPAAMNCRKMAEPKSMLVFPAAKVLKIWP